VLIRTPADLAATIRARRTQLELDQNELAKRAGVSRKWVVEIEGGKSSAAIGLVLRVLRVLEVSLETTDSPKTKPANRATTVDVNAIVDSLKKKK
jgi:HTH-type transcriptional regulator/antitoxin HipB